MVKDNPNQVRQKNIQVNTKTVHGSYSKEEKMLENNQMLSFETNTEKEDNTEEQSVPMNLSVKVASQSFLAGGQNINKRK